MPPYSNWHIEWVLTDNTKLFRQEKDKREKKIELIQEKGIMTIKAWRSELQ